MAPLAAALVVAACGEGGAKVNAPPMGAQSNLRPGTSNTLDQKPNPGGGGATPGGGSLAADLEGKSIIEAKYGLNIKAAGFDFCEGQAIFKINVPAAPKAGIKPKPPLDLKCVSINCSIVGEIRLDNLLGGLSSGTASELEAQTGKGMKLELDEKFIRFSEAGPITYNPPLILIPNFSGGSKEFLKSMNETQPVTLQDSTAGASASGTQTIKTTMFEQSWNEHKIPNVKFEDVFQFQLVNDGFNGIDKIPALLFESFEMTMNLKPIAIGEIQIRMAAADLMAMMKKKDGAAAPVYDPECGPPPPVKPDSGGLGSLLGGIGGGGGSGSPSLLGSIVGVLMPVITKLIKVELKATLLEQKGLKEAFEKQDEFDKLLDSSKVSEGEADKGSSSGSSKGSGSSSNEDG